MQSFINAVELVADALLNGEGPGRAAQQLTQLVANVRRRVPPLAAPDGTPLSVVPVAATFRVFRAVPTTLPGDLRGVAVFLCSSETSDTFGLCVDELQAHHYAVGKRFLLLSEP